MNLILFTKKLLHNKIVRFFLVSGLNTIFGYGLFALLIYLGLHYTLACFIGTIAGILFNFKTIGTIVFKNNKNSRIFRFFGVYGITYLCGTGALALFIYFGVNVYIGGVILLLPMGLFAYTLNHFFVFNNTGSLFAKFKREGKIKN